MAETQFNKIDLYERWLTAGERLGLTGTKLSEYADKNVNDDYSRYERSLDREAKKLEIELKEKEEQRKHEAQTREHEAKTREHEAKMREQDLELQRLRQNNTTNTDSAALGSGSPKLKVSPYKEGECIDSYMKNFENIVELNEWNDKVAMTALHNAFVGSTVSKLVSDLYGTVDYKTLKTEILKACSYTIYEYAKLFNSTKQSKESFRQLYIKLRHYLNR